MQCNLYLQVVELRSMWIGSDLCQAQSNLGHKLVVVDYIRDVVDWTSNTCKRDYWRRLYIEFGRLNVKACKKGLEAEYKIQRRIRDWGGLILALCVLGLSNDSIRTVIVVVSIFRSPECVSAEIWYAFRELQLREFRESSQCLNLSIYRLGLCQRSPPGGLIASEILGNVRSYLNVGNRKSL